MEHELLEAERFRAHNGGMPLLEIGAAISEQLDIGAQQSRVIQHQRIRYACRCCDQGIRVMPAPPRAIPRGLLTEAAPAWIIVGKYMDALPRHQDATLLSRRTLVLAELETLQQQARHHVICISSGAAQTGQASR